MILVSETVLVESEWFFVLQNKICPFQHWVFVSMLAIRFSETPIPLICIST